MPMISKRTPPAILIALLMASCSNVEIVTPDERVAIVNGGFEEGFEKDFRGHGDVPEGWFTDHADCRYILDRKDKREGRQSVRMEFKKSQGNYCNLTQHVDVVDVRGQTLLLTGWIKTLRAKATNQKPPGAVLQVFFTVEDGDNTYDELFRSKPMLGTKGWTRQSVQLRVPDTAVKLIMSPITWVSSGVVWYDDIRLKKT